MGRAGPSGQDAEPCTNAEQRGWTVVDEYVDAGLSGTKDARPALDALMDDAQRGRLDVVAVWRFDRFARSTQHLLRALEEFRALGVDFLSQREAIDTSTPMGRMVFTMIAAVAELEAALIRERVQAGVDRAKAAGKHCGRPRVEIDLRPALAMFEQGYGLKATARAMGVAVTTLRERLKEAGEWPRPAAPARGGAETPAAKRAS
ncbi:MAG: recombinase family protein [Proteobacteria bacterium]|nr:recombinase family protein [Pseudomonadota bacterium]